MSQFKVACIQNCAANDIAHNLAEVEELIRAAAGAGAQLICLPEFYCLLEPSDGSYFENGFDESQHPALQHAQPLASELKCWMSLGSIPVRHANNKVHNRSYIIAPDGRITATYNKVHLFDVAIKDGQQYKESTSVAAGSEAVVTQLPWGQLGLTICYDVRFAYLYRELAQAGADFISIPAAFTAKTGAAHWHTLVRARAIETGCYIFAAGQCGKRPWGRRTYGHSLIVDPWGTVLADAGEDVGFITADIDTDQIVTARTMIPALTHDREIVVALEGER